MNKFLHQDETTKVSNNCYIKVRYINSSLVLIFSSSIYFHVVEQRRSNVTVPETRQYIPRRYQYCNNNLCT